MIHTSEGGMTADQLRSRLYVVARNATRSPNTEVEHFIQQHIDAPEHAQAREIGTDAMLIAQRYRRRP